MLNNKETEWEIHIPSLDLREDLSPLPPFSDIFLLRETIEIKKQKDSKQIKMQSLQNYSEEKSLLELNSKVILTIGLLRLIY